MPTRLLIVASFLFVAAISRAAVPQMINYQGLLVNTMDVASDTSLSMTFRLYDGSGLGAVVLWSETHPSVIVAKGRFDVILGSLSAFSDSIFDRSEVWMGVMIGDDSEMNPRVRLISVGYAFRVGTVDGANGGKVEGDISATGKLAAGSNIMNPGQYAFATGLSCSATGDYSNALGHTSTASGSHSCVSGGQENQAISDWSSVGGGFGNQARNSYASVSGGWSNVAEGYSATVSGGRACAAQGAFSAINGGYQNAAGSYGAAVGGGTSNNSLGYSTVVAGGMHNISSDSLAAIGGGANNRARGKYSVIAGGGGWSLSDSNSTSGRCSVIGGGARNATTGDWAVIAGGNHNSADQWSSIGGGGGNVAIGGGTVAGGNLNFADGGSGFVGGGLDNRAGGFAANIGGGQYNQAVNTHSVVCGGGWNYAAAYATVGGGYRNYARGNYSVVCGGGGDASPADTNSAGGRASIVAGGCRNSARNDYSFAAGYGARAIHDASFVWADFTGYADDDFSSSSDHQFSVRSSGGIRMFTDRWGSIGVTLDASDNTWNSVCDSTLKTDIQSVNTKNILDRVTRLPIKEWSFKGGEPNLRHISPMAQDFWSLFHVGSDSLKISTLDPTGIALAAIQELAKQNRELGAEIAELRSRIDRSADAVPKQIK